MSCAHPCLVASNAREAAMTPSVRRSRSSLLTSVTIDRLITICFANCTQYGHDALKYGDAIVDIRLCVRNTIISSEPTLKRNFSDDRSVASRTRTPTKNEKSSWETKSDHSHASGRK